MNSLKLYSTFSSHISSHDSLVVIHIIHWSNACYFPSATQQREWINESKGSKTNHSVWYILVNIAWCPIPKIVISDHAVFDRITVVVNFEVAYITGMGIWEYQLNSSALVGLNKPVVLYVWIVYNWFNTFFILLYFFIAMEGMLIWFYFETI